MYTLAAGINSLEVFALPAPGRLQSVQQFNISTAVESVGITVSECYIMKPLVPMRLF